MAGQDEALRMSAEIVDRFSPALKDMQKSLRSLSATASEVHKAGRLHAQAHTTALYNLRREVNEITERVKSGLSPAFVGLGLAGIGAAGAIAAVKDSITGFADSSRHLGFLTKQSGFAVQSLREYEALASRIGTSSEAMDRGLASFAAHMQSLGRQGGEIRELNKLFTAMGVQRTAQNSAAFTNLFRSMEHLPREQQLDKLIQFSDRLSDPAQKRKLFEAFGLPGELANKSAAQIKAALADINRNMPALTKGAIESGQKAADAFSRLGESLQSLRDVIGGAFAGDVTKASDALSNFLGDPQNQAQIRETLGEIGKALKDIDWRQIAGDVGDVARSIASVVGYANTLVETLNKINAIKPGEAIRQFFGYGSPTLPAPSGPAIRPTPGGPPTPERTVPVKPSVIPPGLNEKPFYFDPTAYHGASPFGGAQLIKAAYTQTGGPSLLPGGGAPKGNVSEAVSIVERGVYQGLWDFARSQTPGSAPAGGGGMGTIRAAYHPSEGGGGYAGGAGGGTGEPAAGGGAGIAAPGASAPAGFPALSGGLAALSGGGARGGTGEPAAGQGASIGAPGAGALATVRRSLGVPMGKLPGMGGAAGGADQIGAEHLSGAIPADVLKQARAVALQSGPGGVEQFMRANGYPKSGSWCGEFAADVIRSKGGKPPDNPAIASNWRNYGSPTNTPVAGDVAVRRGPPTGSTGSHVTFFEGFNKDGTFKAIGGNQGGEKSFPTKGSRGYDFFHQEAGAPHFALGDVRKAVQGTPTMASAGAMKVASLGNAPTEGIRSGLSGTTAAGNIPGGIDRSSFADKLNDQAFVSRMATMTKGEVGLKSNLDTQKAITEEAFNRWYTRNQPAGADLYHGKGGYYASGTFAKQASPAEIQAYRENVLKPVLGGSNVIKGMTGNASNERGNMVAMHQFQKGTPGFWMDLKTGKPVNLPPNYMGGKAEAMFREAPFKRELPRLPGDETTRTAANALRDMRTHEKFKQTPAPDLIDSGRKAGLLGSPMEHKVTGSASLDINLNGAPRGTTTKMKSEGMFKQVKLNRGRSMPLAHQGEDQSRA